jgi:hypothetical protein
MQEERRDSPRAARKMFPSRNDSARLFLVQITNILNHFPPENPTLSIDYPRTWGFIADKSIVVAPPTIVGTPRADGIPFAPAL